MKFPSFKIALKLPLALVGSAIVVGAGVGIGSYLIASSALEAQARQNLDTIAFERANQLSTYLSSMENDVINTAKAEFVQQAVANFATAWQGMTNVQLNMSASTTLRKAFLQGDPAERINVDNTPGGVKSGVPAAYGFNHSHYNPVFRAQILDEGYHDLYLMDMQGDVVYSTLKADDFAANVVKSGDGKPVDSGLARAFAAAVAAKARPT